MGFLSEIAEKKVESAAIWVSGRYLAQQIYQISLRSWEVIVAHYEWFVKETYRLLYSSTTTEDRTFNKDYKGAI